MPEKRKRWAYRIFNWIDLKLNRFVEMKCNFCKKQFTVTKTEFRTVGKEGSCSESCAKMMMR